MKSKNDIINEIKKIKADLQSKFDVQQIGIFGSYVRGEAEENSDLDILVELKQDSRMSLLGLSIFEDWLSNALGIKVDLVLKSSLKPRIGKKILNEVIYL